MCADYRIRCTSMQNVWNIIVFYAWCKENLIKTGVFFAIIRPLRLNLKRNVTTVQYSLMSI